MGVDLSQAKIPANMSPSAVPLASEVTDIAGKSPGTVTYCGDGSAGERASGRTAGETVGGRPPAALRKSEYRGKVGPICPGSGAGWDSDDRPGWPPAPQAVAGVCNAH